MSDVFSLFFLFFKQKKAYELRISDWSSDVCSSDLCFVSSWRAETLAVAAPLLRTADGECLALVCATPAFQTNETEMRSDTGPRLVSLAARIRALPGDR